MKGVFWENVGCDSRVATLEMIKTQLEDETVNLHKQKVSLEQENDNLRKSTREVCTKHVVLCFNIHMVCRSYREN